MACYCTKVRNAEHFRRCRTDLPTRRFLRSTGGALRTTQRWRHVACVTRGRLCRGSLGRVRCRALHAYACPTLVRMSKQRHHERDSQRAAKHPLQGQGHRADVLGIRASVPTRHTAAVLGAGYWMSSPAAMPSISSTWGSAACTCACAVKERSWFSARLTKQHLRAIGAVVRCATVNGVSSKLELF